MANYISHIDTPRVASEHITKVTVPTGGLKAGQAVIADTLDNSLGVYNYEVYTATQPATGNLGSKMVAVIINDGFETLSDGRRPAGQPNYFKYEFEAGETATAIFLDRHLQFEIGVDCVTGGTTATPASDIGKFLYPTNGTNNLTVGATVPEGTASSLKIIAVRNVPVGGNIDATNTGFAFAYVCVAQ